MVMSAFSSYLTRGFGERRGDAVALAAGIETDKGSYSPPRTDDETPGNS
jgi:hypothetical protein